MDLTRNEAKLITHLTSAQTTMLEVTHWTTGTIPAWRDTTGTLHLDSTRQTLHYPVPKDEKVFFTVAFGGTEEGGCTGSLLLQVTAGGWRSDLGSYNLHMQTGGSTGSTGAAYRRWILGPFESAQFQCSATATAGGCSTGDPCVRFHLSTGTAASTGALRAGVMRDTVAIAPVNLPDVSYAT